MNDTITAKEAALRWGLSERRVTGLCRSGSIPGAVKSGRSWVIPADAEKPADNRLKSGEYVHRCPRTERLPLPIGVSDYRLASAEYYYVDKTLMLKDFLDERPAVSLFTRPRRFGKTLNMDMFRTFFERSDEDTSRYFTDKKIWSCGQKYRDFQGKYPVIFITLKDVKHATWAKTYESILTILSDEYKRHGELLTAPALTDDDRACYEKIASGHCSEVELECSLLKLSELLKKHYGIGAVIIIDEYDTPIQSGHMNGFYDEVISFMRNLLSGGLKDNKNLAFGFLTGILRVAKESIFSGLNNLAVNSVLDNKYSQYFGFTYDEVCEMAGYYGASDRLDEISAWYDGYRFGKTDIFNPWSVINYFANDCEARAFWLSTGSNDIIGEMLKEADNDTLDKLTSLVNGSSFTTYIDTAVIYPQIGSNPSSIYSFLLVAGYLKVLQSAVSLNGDYICEVALPNREISLVYRKEILKRFEGAVPQSTAVAVEEALFTGDAEKLRSAISTLLTRSVSYFDTAGESFYHGFMLGICALFGHVYVTSNRESGKGRYDIQLAPRTAGLPGILIELKAGKDCTEAELKALAAEALKQINDKQYDAELKAAGVETIYKYGVAFSGKNVEVLS